MAGMLLCITLELICRQCGTFMDYLVQDKLLLCQRMSAIFDQKFSITWTWKGCTVNQKLGMNWTFVWLLFGTFIAMNIGQTHNQHGTHKAHTLSHSCFTSLAWVRPLPTNLERGNIVLYATRYRFLLSKICLNQKPFHIAHTKLAV